MAGTFPRFRLYESDGSTPVYEFDSVVDWGDSPFEDPITFAEHTSLRGQGSIISDGADQSWDLPLQFVLIEADYEALVALQNVLPSTIVKNKKYILKIDLTDSTTKDLKVKRLTPIRFPSGTRRKKLVTFADCFITLRVGTWA
jgi:hypothetical protein